MLVDMIDAVLEILECEPEYRAFHLDSQSIVLKDYLEIKPQNKERIIKLTKENRLLHGPWYILPEEFQVGGENHIRNLLLGHKTSHTHGGVSKIGYSPFSWGQISQLPQIYRQFNIDLIMFYRGINSIDSPKAEFLWEGADGTQMVSSRFSTMPRYNFYFYIYRPAVHNEGFYDVEYDWKKGSTPFHFADRMQQDEDYFIISPHGWYYPEHIEPMVSKIIEDQAHDFTTPHKIWMEGHDSSGPNRQTLDIIRDIRKKMPHIDVRHSTLEEYARHLAESVDVDSLKKVYGERRSAQNNNRCGNLFGYTTSARMYLKQANFDAERWIQYYAEPFNIFSGMFGRDINDQYTQTAWELIVQNSAHDSIGGCSLDRIHEDMMLRNKHAVEISKGVFERSLKSLLPKMNTSAFVKEDESDIFITAVNATNYLRNDVVEAFVDIPVSLDKGDFDVYDEQGHKLEKSIISRENHQPVLEQMINRPMFFNMVRYHVRIQMKDVPAFGLKAFKVVPVETLEPAPESADDSLSLQNAFLKVRVREDGSLDITDKQNNISWEGVAWFEDHGDAGHAWVLKPVEPTISTRNTKPGIVKSFTGEVYNEITITHKLMLPASLKARLENTGEMQENNIVLKVGLGKSHRHLSLDVKVNNTSESHRLRMMIPTRLNATHSFGEGQFDVVKRNLERPDTSDWIEQPMYDFPMHHFVDITDGNKGIAALVDGLKEYEVLPDKDKTLAITLFRTFEYKINPAAPQDYSHEKGAQMLGESNYRLALYPHAGDWQQGEVYREAFLFNYPLRLVQTGKLQGELGTEAAMMKITPEDLIFGTMKLPENEEPGTFVLRLYNPTPNTLEGKVEFLKEITSVEKITLEEISRETVSVENGNSFDVQVKSKEIVSFLIKY
jgi:mannosylglycerate hydrolase